MGEKTGLGVLASDNETKFFQIPAKIYRPDEIIERDLFLLYQGQYILYRPKNLIWKAEDADHLSRFDVDYLYIECANSEEHYQFLEGNLTRILDEPGIDRKQKSQVLYETSSSVIEEVFSRPGSPENVRRSVSLVKNSVEFLRDQENFIELMRLASTDFNEYTHAIQTSAYAIAFAKHLGMTSFNDLSAIGIGSLLHDIGKSKIDPRLLSKKGRLTSEERREVQKHAEYGYEILSRQRSIPELSEQIVLQHHERPNGGGYPYQMGSDMLQSAKIVSISDCFDSLTSDRPWSARLKPSQAVEFMFKESKGDFDQNLMKEFVKVLAFKKEE